MEEEPEQPYGAAMESFRSWSASSATFSFRSEDSLDVGYRPPVSEYEEIPSTRWLPSPFRSRSTPSPSRGEGDAASRTRRAGYHFSVSVFGVRRSNQVANEQELRELGLFQTVVADCLQSLVSDGGEGEREKTGRQRRPMISLCFLRRLLEAFVCIECEFKVLLLVLLDDDPALIRGPPLDRIFADLFDREVRSLDVCNAVAEALDLLQFCKRYAEIASSALHVPPSAAAAAAAPMTKAQFHRARKALSNLLAVLFRDQYRHHGATKERAWLFGRSSSRGAASNGDGVSGDPAASRYGRRYLSLGVSKNWSTAKQVEAIWANFAPTLGANATGLAMAVYTMNAVMVLVEWTLLLAFPCQGQGGQGPSAVATGAGRSLAPPWPTPWAAPMVALQERIAEECRRDRKGSPGWKAPSPGLLAELQSLAQCGRAVVELGGGAPVFPLNDRQQEDVADIGRALAATCQVMEEQLGTLQRQVTRKRRKIQLDSFPLKSDVLVMLDSKAPAAPKVKIPH